MRPTLSARLFVATLALIVLLLDISPLSGVEGYALLSKPTSRNAIPGAAPDAEERAGGGRGSLAEVSPSRIKCRKLARSACRRCPLWPNRRGETITADEFTASRRLQKRCAKRDCGTKLNDCSRFVANNPVKDAIITPTLQICGCGRADSFNRDAIDAFKAAVLEILDPYLIQTPPFKVLNVETLPVGEKEIPATGCFDVTFEVTVGDLALAVAVVRGARDFFGDALRQTCDIAAPGGQVSVQTVGEVTVGLPFVSAFLSDRKYTAGEINGAAGADAICRDVVKRRGITTAFAANIPDNQIYAWLSEVNSDFSDYSDPSTRWFEFVPDKSLPVRTLAFGGSEVNAGGPVVANSFDDLLLGNLVNPIAISADGSFQAGTTPVWTNTRNDGIIFYGFACSSRSGGSFTSSESPYGESAGRGSFDTTKTAAWSLDFGEVANSCCSTCDVKGRLYCFITPPPLFSISGKVLDSTNNSPLAGATVELSFGSDSGNVIQTATTDDRGTYTFTKLLSEVYFLKGTNDGFFSRSIQVPYLNEDLTSPGPADIFLSPELLGPDYRIVLTWNEKPLDIDLELLCPWDCKVVYSSRECQSPLEFSDKVMTAILDIDVEQGFGPETITIRNVGPYTEPAKEGLNPNAFLVQLVQYDGPPPTFAQSGATVAFFDKNGFVKEFKVDPACVDYVTSDTGRYQIAEVSITNYGTVEILPVDCSR